VSASKGYIVINELYSTHEELGDEYSSATEVELYLESFVRYL